MGLYASGLDSVSKVQVMNILVSVLLASLIVVDLVHAVDDPPLPQGLLVEDNLVDEPDLPLGLGADPDATNIDSSSEVEPSFLSNVSGFLGSAFWSKSHQSGSSKEGANWRKSFSSFNLIKIYRISHSDLLVICCMILLQMIIRSI